jgi:Rap1a immunity proteins
MQKATQPLIAVTMLFFLGIASASTANAAVGALMTGKTLALLCTSTVDKDQAACQSYIAGVVDYHNLLRSLGTAPTVNYCLPDSLTMAQTKNIVTRYIMSRAEHQDFIAAPAVAMALYNAYPCPKQRKH